MIGDTSNQALKARVDALCRDLAAAPGPAPAAAEQQPAQTSGWRPPGLGMSSATGGQNGMCYASFPDQHRLAVEQDGRVPVCDTAGHRITGFFQQHCGQSLSFTSPNGIVRLRDQKEI